MIRELIGVLASLGLLGLLATDLLFIDTWTRAVAVGLVLLVVAYWGLK